MIYFTGRMSDISGSAVSLNKIEIIGSSNNLIDSPTVTDELP